MIFINHNYPGEAFIYHNVRKTPSLQGGDISTNLLIFDVFFDNIKRCSATGCYEITR